MNTRRITTIAIVMLALAVPVLVSRSVIAGPPAPNPAAGAITLAGTVASKISYQGRLTDSGGTPLNGNYNLVFQLWDDDVGGGQVGGDIVRNNVPVSNGLFTLDLDVPQEAFNGQALWLRIQVSGQWLTPRQELLPVPYALSLRPGARIEGSSTDAIASVINQALGVALYAQGATGIEGVGMIGVQGQGDIGVRGNGLTGVYGESEIGYGVIGITHAPMTVTTAAGVYGESMNGHGVEGVSQFDVGVFGQSHGGFGAGVSGAGVTGVFGTGGMLGVSGYTESDDGIGVAGTATGYGGRGVEGSAQFGTGVLGTGETGVKGTSSVGPGVRGEGSVGVQGFSSIGDGVAGESQAGYDAAAVRGTATGDAYGGHFTSANSSGVVGVGYEGVHGEATSSIGYGVHGMSNHIAVQGDGGATGVSGSGSVNGVYGYSDMGNGVEGRSTSGAGVLGVSTSAEGVVGNSQSGVAVYGNTGSGTAAVMGEGPKGVYGKSSADGGEGVVGEGLGQLTEGVLGSSAYAHGVGGYSSGTNGSLAIGVWGQTTATWGLGTNEHLWVGGNCTGCTVAFVGQNDDPSTLEMGEVVSISGIASPLKGQQTPVLKVRRATAAGEGVLGVVQARAVVEEVPAYAGAAGQADAIQMPGLAPGTVAPGDYLFVVVQGLVQVRADASAGAIEAGDPVGPATTGGLVQKLSTVAPATPVLGRALEPLTKGAGLIWVLVLGR